MPRGLYVLHALISSFSFLINFWAKWSQDLLDRFSANFHHMVVIWSQLRIWPFFSIAHGTLPRKPILGQTRRNRPILTFIRRSGIPKRIAMSPLWFWKVYLQWFGYTLNEFGELWSSNSVVYEGERCVYMCVCVYVFYILYACFCFYLCCIKRNKNEL